MVLQVIKQTILIFFLEIINLEGQMNRFIGSKVTEILLNGRILPTGGVHREGCALQPAQQACFSKFSGELEEKKSVNNNKQKRIVAIFLFSIEGTKYYLRSNSGNF